MEIHTAQAFQVFRDLSDFTDADVADVCHEVCHLSEVINIMSPMNLRQTYVAFVVGNFFVDIVTSQDFIH